MSKQYKANLARHSENCLVSLESWAAEDPDKNCDCELGALRSIARGGAWLISVERRSQISKGYVDQVDDRWKDGQLAQAAISYLFATDGDAEFGKRSTSMAWIAWPWDEKFWKPRGRIENLIRAGAFIAAEIDRLSRIQEKNA